jgi:NAD(P)-dependent dehydrogenase (short-subunit alcohol dehydrogenase family)
MEKAEKARREIIDSSGNDLVEVMQVPPTHTRQLSRLLWVMLIDDVRADLRAHTPQVDLTSFDSVRNFAREFERRDLPLHVLVNNASANPITVLCVCVCVVVWRCLRLCGRRRVHDTLREHCR